MLSEITAIKQFFICLLKLKDRWGRW